jgi:hypothetical protein
MTLRSAARTLRAARFRLPGRQGGGGRPAQGADRHPRPRHRDRSELASSRHVSPRIGRGTSGERRSAEDLDGETVSDQESGVPQVEWGLLRGTLSNPGREDERPGSGVKGRFALLVKGTTGVSLLARRPLARHGFGNLGLPRTASAATPREGIARLSGLGHDVRLGRFRHDGIAGGTARGRGFTADANGWAGPGAFHDRGAGPCFAHRGQCHENHRQGDPCASMARVGEAHNRSRKARSGMVRTLGQLYAISSSRTRGTDKKAPERESARRTWEGLWSRGPRR